MRSARLTIACVLLAFSFHTAAASTLHVYHPATAPSPLPANSYTSIQQAVCHAVDGDCILVGPGTYCEEVEIGGISSNPITDVSLVSEMGPGSTLIQGPWDRATQTIVRPECGQQLCDGQPQRIPGIGILIQYADRVTVCGFTITGFPLTGYGVQIRNSNRVLIHNNVIHGNGSSGIDIPGSFSPPLPDITWAIIDANTVYDNGYGIIFDGSAIVEVRNNISLCNLNTVTNVRSDLDQCSPSSVRETTGCNLIQSSLFGCETNCTAWNCTTWAVDKPSPITCVECTIGATSGACALHGCIPPDTTPPTITCPQPVTRPCTSVAGAVVEFEVSVQDDVDPNPVVVCVPASGSTFALGATSVFCTAADASGNTSACSFDITVGPGTACDVIPPAIQCPEPLVATCSSPEGAAVSFNLITSDDTDTSPVVSCSQPSGSIFAIGATTVTCTAQDDAGNTSSCTFAVTVNEGIGSLQGTVVADCPIAGTPLFGVDVDVFGLAGMLASATTDEQGHYLFSNLPSGQVLHVSIVTPLGYMAVVEESAITIDCGESATVDFELRCQPVVADPRTVGYWKHQVGVATGGPGTAQVSPSTLCNYLDLIAVHFNDNGVNPVVVYQPPTSGTCVDKLLVAREILNIRGSVDMRTRARQQLLALLLNVAGGLLSLQAEISVDYATVSQAITYCDREIDKPAGDYERAKSIADDINNGRTVVAGLIDLDTESIAYKPGQPLRYDAMTYPNPFNPQTTISLSMPVRGEFRMVIYNVRGQVVRQFGGTAGPGVVNVRWDGTDGRGFRIASGTYQCRVTSGNFLYRKSLVMLK